MSTLFFEWALLPEGWRPNVRITQRNGRIDQITPHSARQNGDGGGGIALPGMASLHSHSFQRGMAGLAEVRGPAGDSFWTWRQVMYRFLDVLDASDVEAIAAYAFMDMLEGGFTSVGEFHYLHHDVAGAPYANPAEHCERIAAAAAATGIGLTLLPVFYAHGGFGGLPPTQGQRRFISTPDSFLKLVEGARRAVAGLAGANVGIAPHSLRAATPDELAEVVTAPPAGPIHIHIAEQTKEVDDCLAWSGVRPVDWLMDHANVDERWCLIHATHLSAGEVRRIAASGAVAGLCPMTESNLGDGVFSGPDFLAQGGRFGVGTDSNIEITAAGELKQLEYSQRLLLRARNVLAPREGASTGQALYQAAATGGAQAMQRPCAALAVGQMADIVVLDAGHPDLAAATPERFVDAYVFVAGKAAIRDVYVQGQHIVQQGRHPLREAVSRRYVETLRRITATL